MRAPRDVDFEEYRLRALACLELLGEVKAGEIIELPDGRYFIQRNNHANRSKTPAEQKKFKLYQPLPCS